MNEAPARVPRHLWVVGVITLLWNAIGAFDYAYRYSVTGGRDWVYADLDGIGNGGAHTPHRPSSQFGQIGHHLTPPMPAW